MNLDLKIERRPIERLIPFARNPGTHTDEQIAQIAASIAEFGWTNPVLIGADGVIIAGHARVLAARKLGLEEVPVIVLDHLSEAQRRALVIADNQLALTGTGWDQELLRGLLTELREDEFKLDLLGFADEELNALLTEPPDLPEGASPTRTPFPSHSRSRSPGAAICGFSASTGCWWAMPRIWTTWAA